MQQRLPTAANLAFWKKTPDTSCQLCNSGKPQTNKHVLSNCSWLAALERYKRRHNGILETLADWLDSVISSSQSILQVTWTLLRRNFILLELYSKLLHAQTL